ncbi:hypothetical protein CsSME_00032500 [Camellia sinensis var. sinensis]
MLLLCSFVVLVWLLLCWCALVVCWSASLLLEGELCCLNGNSAGLDFHEYHIWPGLKATKMTDGLQCGSWDLCSFKAILVVIYWEAAGCFASVALLIFWRIMGPFTVENPNHGSFKFQNSTAYATYRGVEAASAPIEADTIPARANHDISTTVLVVADKLVSNPDFGADLASGCINFTTSVTLHGKVTALKFLKTKATVYGSCDVSLYYLAENLTSVCWSSIKY